MEEQKPEPPGRQVSKCPSCSEALDVSGLAPYSKIECPACGASVRVRTAMGRYQITGTLGEGGMSMVFKAMDVNLGREVALKVLHQNLSRDAALTAMFEREAKLTASVLHPNVVKVYTVGKEQGYFFIAMELVEAVSLEQLIAEKGSLSERDVLSIAHDVTSGLKAALHEDLIHRDIKPGNMLVTEDGTAKLVDFGLAVQQGGEDETEELWATPFYVPPEKLDGAPDTYHGDIYSLGATIYHALAGEPPFDANTSSMEELKRIKRNKVDLRAKAPGASRATVRLVELMMAYDPAERPGSYDDILRQIERIRARKFGVQPPSRTAVKGDGTRWFRIGAGLGGAAVAVAVAVVLLNREEEEIGEVGLGAGERLISAGEHSIADRFGQAREALVAGEFREAARSFEELSEEESIPAYSRKWSHFLHGLARLFLGEELAARSAFGEIASVESAGEENALDAVDFLRRAGEALSGPFPVLEGERKFDPDSVDLIGLLAAGLKNWHAGEFESGIALLRSFRDSPPPEGYDWIGGLRERVSAYERDYALLEDLPNPSRRRGEDDWDAQRAALQEALPRIATGGAVRRLVAARLERIDAIESLAAAEAEAAAAEAAPGPEPAPAPDPAAGAAAEERRRLAGLLSAERERVDALDFEGAASALETVEFATAEAGLLRDDFVHAHREAGAFIPMLASRLDGAGYEGVVRRREGVPLEAAVTGADSRSFIVDLGFGPNEVEVRLFAPDWLVEVAVALLPEPGPEVLDDWAKTVYFALVTGQREESLQLAQALAPASPGFAERWTRIAAFLSEAGASGESGSGGGQ